MTKARDEVMELIGNALAQAKKKCSQCDEPGPHNLKTAGGDVVCDECVDEAEETRAQGLGRW